MFTWRWRGGLRRNSRGGVGGGGGRRLQSSYVTRTGSGTSTEELAIDRLIALPAVVFIQMCIYFLVFVYFCLVSTALECLFCLMYHVSCVRFHGASVEYMSGRCFSAPIQVSSCMARVCAWMCVHICVLLGCFHWHTVRVKDPNEDLFSSLFFCNLAHFWGVSWGWIQLLFFCPPFFGGLTFLWQILAFLT